LDFGLRIATRAKIKNPKSEKCALGGKSLTRARGMAWIAKFWATLEK
jgi:hypothetical protein